MESSPEPRWQRTTVWMFSSTMLNPRYTSAEDPVEELVTTDRQCSFPFATHMPDVPAPAFRVNDHVVVIAPSGLHQDASGRVVEIYVFSGMYRYVVEFETGTTAVFFSFELRRVHAQLE